MLTMLEIGHVTTKEAEGEHKDEHHHHRKRRSVEELEHLLHRHSWVRSEGYKICKTLFLVENKCLVLKGMSRKAQMVV